MNTFLLHFIASLFFLLPLAAIAAPTEQSESTSIPLNKVWAWDMPGTIDIRSLEPDCFGDVLKGVNSAEQVRLQERSLISQSLRPRAKRDEKRPESAFAVRGTGLEALKNVHAVLAKNMKPPKSFSPQDDISIVFFSGLYGAYVHIEEVRQQGARVEIKYRFVPHMEAELTANFALIPLKKLPVGEVDVAIVKLPLDKKSIDIGASEVSDAQASRIVCKPFKFVVEGTR